MFFLWFSKSKKIRSGSCLANVSQYVGHWVLGKIPFLSGIFISFLTWESFSTLFWLFNAQGGRRYLFFLKHARKAIRKVYSSGRNGERDIEIFRKEQKTKKSFSLFPGNKRMCIDRWIWKEQKRELRKLYIISNSSWLSHDSIWSFIYP